MIDKNRPTEIEGYKMPFSGHSPEDLSNCLDFINNCGLTIEAFDAFLSDYAENKDLQSAIWFASCEWDL